ncbi:MAG: MgtC/SapB family protein [Bacillota bacterium]
MAGEREIIINLLLIVALSGLIGFERERHERPAGLRTHILVGVGATILMMISISMNKVYPLSDAGRIAAQVVSGIGFLGAGTIIKEGFSVTGLTTAASLWATAAIGLAVGGGYYLLASTTTLFVIIALFVLNRLEFKLGDKSYQILKCQVKDRPGVLGEISTILGKKNIDIKDLTMEKNEKDKEKLWIEFTLKTPREENIDSSTVELLEIEDIIELKWEDI